MIGQDQNGSPTPLRKALTPELYNLGCGGLTYASFTVVKVLTTTALIHVYTKYFSPEDMGLVTICQTVTGIAALLMSLGIPLAHPKLFYQEPTEDGRRRVTLSMALLVTFFTAVACMLCEVIGPFITNVAISGLRFEPLLRFALWTGGAQAISSVPISLFRVRHQAFLSSGLLISQIVVQVCVVFLVLSHGVGLLGFVRAVFHVEAVFCVLYCGLLLAYTGSHCNAAAFGQILTYGLSMLPTMLAFWAMSLFDRFLLQDSVSLHLLGLYSVGSQIGGALNMLASSLNLAWAPYCQEKLVDEGGPLLVSQLIGWGIPCLFWLGLGMSIFAPELVILLANPTYIGAWPTVVLTAQAATLYGIYYLVSPFLFKNGNVVKSQPIIAVVAAAAHIVLDVLLLSTWGIIGAAWISIVSKGILLTGVSWVAARFCGFVFPWRSFVASVIGFLVLFFLSTLLNGVPLGIARVLGKLAVLTFPLIALFFLRRKRCSK